jgi:hypothetical protein
MTCPFILPGEEDFVSQLVAPVPPGLAPPIARPPIRLSRWEVSGLGGLALLFVIFGIVTEWRSAFLQRPMTDLQVYLRAAWAVRTGENIYTITDNNHWHYHYPPLLVILAMPLADAPPNADRTGLLPFSVSVAIWYWLSVVLLIAGVHSLAGALEPHTAPWSPRWWGLRFWPLAVCLSPLLATLVRGQINVMVVALICFAGAAGLRGRSWRSGLWIALAICLKVIPGLLLLYPLRRRDYRCLGGCVLGLVLGMVVVPALWFGPERAVTCYTDWFNVFLRPAFGVETDHARDIELMWIPATDSQSLMAMIHNTLHLDRMTRPFEISPQVRLAHWLSGALLVGVTLLAARPAANEHRMRPLLLLGALSLIMLLLSPVSHLHYFCLALPLVMGLIAYDWQRQGTMHVGLGLMLVLVVFFVVNVVPHVPGTDMIRDLGLIGYAAILLWLASVVALWRTRPRAAVR